MLNWISCRISKLLFFILMLFGIFGAADLYAQSTENKTITLEHPTMLDRAFRLGNKITESSGLIYFDEGFWTFNDSGGKPELYKLRATDGVLVRTVVIENATNVDWEDLTQDDEFMYVSDAGNNRGSRKDLRVYKIRKKSIQVGEKNRVQAEVITFAYGDQESFRDRNRNNDYDSEAILSYDKSLILFSKNWVDKKTRLYHLSKKPGKYTIVPITEFDIQGLVTAADYHPSGKQLVLLGYNNSIPFVYILRDFSGNDFDGMISYRINFPEMKGVQTEGVCFVNEDKIAISSEKTSEFKQAVYTVDIRDLLASGSNEEQE